MISDLKNILKHGSIYSVGSILSKMVGFFMIPLYTSYLTTDDYGVLELLTLVSAVLSNVLALRIGSALMRYYFKYQTIEDRNRLVSSSLNFLALMAICVAVILPLNRSFFSRLVFSSSAYEMYFVWVFISLAFEVMGYISFAYLRIIEKSVVFITISIVQLMIGLALNIYFIAGLKLGVNGILYSMIISNGIVCLFLNTYIYFQVGFHFDFSMLKKLISFGLPLVPAGLLIFTLNMGDRFIMNKLLDLGEVGIYSLGYKFGMLLSVVIGSPFASIWGPKRVEIYENRINKGEIFARVFKYFTLALATMGLAISVLIQDGLKILAAPEYWSAYRVVPLVILGYIFYNLYYFVDIGFYVHNKTYFYVIINATAAAVNVGLNILLIPLWGSMGAAVVTAISFAVCPVFAYFVSRRYYRIRYDFIALSKLIIVTLLFFFACTAVTFNTIIASIAYKMILLAIVPVVLYVLGYFDTKEISHISYFLSKRLHVLRT
jgi:O-antigen/teichoic acid export membrane protein